MSERIAAPAVGTLSNWHVFCLATLLFLSSNVIFAVTALQPMPAAVVLTGCAGVGWFVWRSRADSRLLSTALEPDKFGWCLAIGFALCLLGGETHLFYTNFDWLVRDAVFADLVRDGARALYEYDGKYYQLRAPIGMYMLPSTIGQIFGLFAAHLTLLSQNAIIFGSILYLASILAGARTAVFLAVLIAFSGLDILGYLAVRGATSHFTALSSEHLEWWSRALAPLVRLQYSSHLTQLFWVPNHAAPGWFVAILVVLRARREIELSTFVVCCATLVLWSPLAVVGAIPFIALLVMQAPLRTLFTSDSILGAATSLCFLPIAFYLTTGLGTLTHGQQIAITGFSGVYIPFLLVEIPQAAVIFLAWRRMEITDRRALIVAVVTLVLLPLYAFGPANDLVLRASIPSLFLLAFAFARIVASTPRDNGAFARIISAMVLISATTPVIQLSQALFWKSYAISDCNMLTVEQSLDPMGFPTNYLVAEEATHGWLTARGSRPPLRVEYRDCWPDHPLRAFLRGDQG